MMTLAELNMDAAVHASPAQASTSSPEDTARSRDLQICASWLALVQEADLLGPAWAEGKDAAAALDQRCSNPDSEQTVEGTSQAGHYEQSSKLSWRAGSAGLAVGSLINDRTSRAQFCTLPMPSWPWIPCGMILPATPAIQPCSHPLSVGSSTVTQEGAVSISLQHCQQDAVISSSSIMAKLQVLKLAETRQEASSLLEAGASTEALALLEQELLQDPALAAKASQHDATGFVTSLELLLVSASAKGMLLAALKVGSLLMAVSKAFRCSGACLTRCMSPRDCS